MCGEATHRTGASADLHGTDNWNDNGHNCAMAHMDSTCRLRGDLFVTWLANRDGSFKQSDYSRAKGAVGSF